MLVYLIKLSSQLDIILEDKYFNSFMHAEMYAFYLNTNDHPAIVFIMPFWQL